MSNPSPTCLINGLSALNGQDVAAASTVTIQLASLAGAEQWALTCLSTDEANDTAAINAQIAASIDQTLKTATFTAPAVGSAVRLQSQVGISGLGRDTNNIEQESFATTLGVYVATADGNRVMAMDEALEGSAAFGWITKINALIRAATTALASIFRWTPTGNTHGSQQDDLKSTTTANATPVVLDSYTLAAGEDAKFIAIVMATKSDQSVAAEFWKCDRFKRIGAANPAVRSLSNGANVDLGSDANGTAWTAVISVNATAVELKVTGQAATNITWTGRLQVISNK